MRSWRCCSRVRVTVTKLKFKFGRRRYDTVLRLSGVVVDDNVHLAQLSSQQEFFDALEAEVVKAEAFYRQRLVEAIGNFYLLLQSAIEQGLLEHFRPYQIEGGSRLARELRRLDLTLDVHFGADDADAADAAAAPAAAALASAHSAHSASTDGW